MSSEVSEMQKRPGYIGGISKENQKLIELLSEKKDYRLAFMRPRREGKSLVLEMLKDQDVNYYYKNSSVEFISFDESYMFSVDSDLVESDRSEFLTPNKKLPHKLSVQSAVSILLGNSTVNECIKQTRA